MTTTNRTIAAKISEAEGALDALRDALTRSGVQLPSLGLDAMTWSDDSGHALIELGRCNLDTARALTTALRATHTEGAS